MKRRLSMLTVLLTLITVIATGCLGYRSTERAAIVLINDSANVIEYSFLLSGQWTAPTSLAMGAADFVLIYEQHDPNEPLMRQLQQLKLKTPACTATLNRQQLEKHFIKNPKGRQGWDLPVTPALLSQLSCR